MCGTRGTFFKDKRRGAVLILVLFVLTGLSVLTVEFSRDILLDHAMSTSTRSILAAKPLMESGERLATAVLTRNSEAGTPDHVREDWGLFGLGLERLSAELPGADLSGSIEDENSRFPINAIFYEREADRARAEAFADILTRLRAGLMRVPLRATMSPFSYSRSRYSAWSGAASGDTVHRHIDSSASAAGSSR